MALMKGKLTNFAFDGANIAYKSIKETVEAKSAEVTNNNDTSVKRKTTRETVKIELSGTVQLDLIGQVGKGLKLTYNAVDYKTTDLSFDETWPDFDTTHGTTSGNATEHDVGLPDRKMTASVWREDTVADPPRGTEHAATLLFSTGATAAGALTLDKKDSDGEINNDVKLSLGGFFNGDVTLVGLGLTGGVSKAAVATYADGITDKAVSGNAILIAQKFSTNIDGDVNFSYTFLFTGAITETEKT